MMQNEVSTSRDITPIIDHVVSAVVGEFNMQVLLDQIINTSMDILHAEVCSIFLEDKEADEIGVLECVAGSGFAESIIGVKYKLGEGFTGSVFQTGQEFNLRTREELENLEIDGKFVWSGKYDKTQWPSGKSEFRNCIALPLKIKEQTLGVIKVENKIEEYGDSFSSEDLTIFKTIAAVISLVLENTRLIQITEEQSKKISEVLSEVANAVVGQFDMPILLEQIIDTTMTTLHAEICSIFLEDKEKEPGVLECVAGAGLAKRIIGVKYKYGEGFTGSVAQSGKEFNLRTREELENLIIDGKNVWKGKCDKTQWPSGESEYRNGIGIPLRIKDQILGVIKVENKIEEFGNFFSDEDFSNFKTIANVVALTIENARLIQKTEEQSKNISNALAGVASAVVGEFNMQFLLDQIINTSMDILHAEVCSIFLEDKEADEPGVLECVAGSGFAESIIGVKYQIGEGFTGSVFQSGQEFNLRTREELENLEIDGKIVWRGKYDKTQWPSGKSEFRNCIALPLKIKEQTLGVIKVENKIEEYGDSFSSEDLTIFKTIANVVALTIENARLLDKIETQLKTISVKAAHRINNQTANYDGIDLDLAHELANAVINKDNVIEIHRRLKTTTRNLKNMIGEFRDFGKPLVLRKSRGSINQIVRDEVWLAKPKGINISDSYDQNIPDFSFDGARFAESIKELLSNAIRAIDSAGHKKGHIIVTTRLIQIDNKDFAEIRIEDNGPGFPTNFPIFEPFTSTYPEGTGLGLTTVKELFEKHGGTVSIDQSSSGGANVECRIPITF